MNNQHIQYWNLPKVFQHFDLWSETPTTFYNVLVVHKLYELCLTHGYGFSKTTQRAVRSSSRFSNKISIWTCWDIDLEIPKVFFALNNCLGKLVRIAITKRLRVRWRSPRQGNMDPVQLRQLRYKGCTWCWLIFAPKESQRWKRWSTSVSLTLSNGSEEVLSSLSYLYCKVNSKRVSDKRSKCWDAHGRFQGSF